MPKPSFKTYHPLSLRLWHWLNAAAILGLLTTVLLRKTLLSWRTNSALIEAKLKAAGTTITPELAKDIAVSIRNPLWDWHITLGLILSALIIGRILIAIFVEKKCAALTALKNPQGLHHTMVKISYAVFYLATSFMVITGLMMTYKTELGLAKDLVTSTKELHELMMWFFVVFVGGHLSGVIVAELRGDRGLVSDMIHGGDR